MFKRKKPTPEDQAISLVQSYATKLGIERRQSARVRFPSQYLTSLPCIFFGERAIRVHDMSVGGTCLIDQEDHLGPSAGIEVDLRLIWPDGERPVRARIVSAVHNRRHIQFIDLPADLVTIIKSAIAPGVLALTMKPLMDLAETHLSIHAQEVWTSLNGECLTFLDDVHVGAELYLDGKNFKFLRDSWPVNKENLPATPREVEHILVFLENVPQPSKALTDLKAQLQTLYFEGRS